MTFTKDRWPIEVLLYIGGRMMPMVMVTLETTTARERHSREPQSSTGKTEFLTLQLCLSGTQC